MSPLLQFHLLSLGLVGLSKVFLENEQMGSVRVMLAAVIVLAAIRAWKHVQSSTQAAIVTTAAAEGEVFEETDILDQTPSLAVVAQDIPMFFQPLFALHTNDRPFEAINMLKQMRETSPQEFVSPPTAIADMLAKVDEQRQEIFRLTTLLEQESNWKFRMKHKNVDVFLSNSDSRDFKVVCECKGCDLFSIISIIYETHLYKHWVPGVSQSARWKLSAFQQRLYLRFPLPFPMKDREVLLKGYGDVHNGGVIIYVASSESKEAERRLGVKPNALRCDVIFAGFLIKPRPNDDVVEITMCSRLDLKMPLLPDSMIDYASKFVLAELLACIRDMTRGMRANPKDGKYKRWLDCQTGEDAQIYQEIRTRLAQI